jgi:hypothetical protein
MTVSTYADPAGVSNPTSGSSAPATWFTQLNTNFLAIRNRPSAQIRASALQSLGLNATTAITMGTVVFDNSSLMTGTANKLTIPTSYAGKWLVTVQIRVDTTPSGGGHYIEIDVLKTGAAWRDEFIQRSAASGSLSTLSASYIDTFSVADTISMQVTTSTNISAAATVVTEAYTSLSAFWLSA